MKKIIDQIRELAGARLINKEDTKGFGEHVPDFVLETIKLKSFNEFNGKKSRKSV